MKTARLLLSTLVLSLGLGTGLTHAKEGDAHDLNPKHGGIVSESSHMEFELVLNPQATELYVRDHGRPVDLTQAKGKLMLVSGGKKTEIELVGSATMLKGNAFELGVGGYTAVATVELSNKKKITVRFKSK